MSDSPAESLALSELEAGWERDYHGPTLSTTCITERACNVLFEGSYKYGNIDTVSFLVFYCTSSLFSILSIQAECRSLLQVGRVAVVLQTNKVFLDAARRDEAVEYGHAARFVVRTARARTAEGLLADYGAGALFVVVDVAGSGAQLVGRLNEGLALGREAKVKM